MRTRQMRGSPGQRPCYRSPSSDSDVFYSDEESSTQLREGLSVGLGELYIDTISIDQGSDEGELFSLGPGVESLEFNTTIVNDEHYHNLLRVRIDNYRLSATEDIFSDNE